MSSRFSLVRETVAQELARPYAYGSADCFMLGCRVADALAPDLGLTERYGGLYSTLAGAHRALRRAGFASLAGLFGSHFEAIAPAAAETGDLVIIRMEDGEHVGVAFFAAVVTKTARGRATRPISDVVAAFRVGRS